MRLWTVLTVLFFAAPAWGEVWKPVTVGKVDGLSNIVVSKDGKTAYAVAQGKYFAVTIDGRLNGPVEAPIWPSPPTDMIPHGNVAVGQNHIKKAWLVQPTLRYGHGALGDKIEARGFKVQLRDGRELVYELADQYVFEDLSPRLADVDGDGLDEIILVRASLSEGAAVSIYRVGERRLEHFAVSLSIGLAYRWLNPVGVADFDADGEMDVAVVEMPHLGRSLVIYSRTASRLKERGRLSGFSNHHMGSTILDLSVAFDVNNDGVVDMILPDEERRLLQAMTFKGGEFKRIAEGPVGAVITTSVVAGDFNGNGAIDFVYGRADGTIEAVFR